MRKVVILAAALFLLVPALARAQAFIAPFYGWDFGGSAGNCPSFLNDCSEKKSNFGVTIGYSGLIGLEEDISYAPNFFGSSSAYGSNSVLTLMTHISIGFPTGPVRPYISGGIGLVRTNVEVKDIANLFSFKNSSFGYDLGAGLNLLFPHHLGVRLDYRNFRSTGTLSVLEFLGSSNNQKLNYSRFSIGLLLH